jgi:drug/metabolite transporter (DMT)-like permease
MDADLFRGPVRPPILAYLSLVASMALVGAYVALSKPLTDALPVTVLAWLRFAVAAVALLPWTGTAPGAAPLPAHDRARLFALSFFGNFLFSLCMLAGVARSGAAAAGIVLSTLPAAVALLSVLWLRERLGMRAFCAVALAAGGVMLLQSARMPQQPAPAGLPAAVDAGSLLLLAAVACEAAYVILSRQLALRHHPLRISAWVNLWGLALMTPWAVWQMYRSGLPSLPPSLWILLVFYALSASLFAVWLWMTGMRQVPAHQAGLCTAALPVSAALVAVLFLGEPFTAQHALALAATVGAIVLAAWNAGARGGPHGEADRRSAP